MRISPLLLLAGLLLPGAAAANCQGTDLMDKLAAEAPEVHAGIMARAAEVPNAEGIFWLVEREGTAPSHLYGTVHGTEAAERGMSEASLAALRASRLLMVEITPDEQSRMERRVLTDPDFVLNPDPPTLSGRIDAAVLEDAAPLLAARGMPLAMADQVKPWMLISVVAIPLCEMRALLSGKTILDERIVELAEEAGVPVAGLETYQEALSAFEDMNSGAMTDLLASGLAGIPYEEDLRRTLENFYIRGETAAILEFNLWFSQEELGLAESRAATQELERTLIAGRNNRWMEGLLPELEEGGVFVASGALHLPGEDGLIEILRGEGYTVTRLDN